jgi:hypothetical protein
VAAGEDPEVGGSGKAHTQSQACISLLYRFQGQSVNCRRHHRNFYSDNGIFAAGALAEAFSANDACQHWDQANKLTT